MTIKEEIVSNGRLFSIIDSGSSCSFASFQWHLSGLTGLTSDIIVGTNSTYLYTSIITGLTIYVIVSNYTETYWNGGEFYGGNFYGNFGGGTFHYGQLNDCFYLKQEIKPRPFIEDINKPTGPQSVKPVNTSRLL